MTTFSLGASGVPTSYKLPKAFVQVFFGASPAGSGGGAFKLLFLGNKTSAGSATADTDVKRVTVDDDASAFWGEGSELALMVAAARTLYPLADIYGIAITEATGTKASATLTVATTATGAGTYKLYIHGVVVDVPVYVDDTSTTIAANVDKYIKANSAKLNVTSSVLGSVVTITARHNGTRGNLIRLKSEVPASITGTTFTLSATVLSGGTGDDSLTAGLSTASTSHYDRYVHAHVTSTQLAALKAQLNTLAGPLVGKRQQSICCVSTSLGSATTLIQTVNAERMQALWLVNASTLPCVIAAAWAGLRTQGESDSIGINLSTWSPDRVNLGAVVAPPYAESDWLADSQAALALDVGLTPVQIMGPSKAPTIVLSITTRSLDSGGNPDTRVLTTNYVTVPDEIANEFERFVMSEFKELNIVAEPQSTDDPTPGNCTTPNTIKTLWFNYCKSVFANPAQSHLHDIDADYKSWAFNRAAGAPNRVNATMPITPAAWLTQISAQFRQNTPQV